MKSTVSLETLARAQDSTPPRRRLPAWMIPGVILLGFAFFFVLLFGDRLLPAPEVEVAVVLATPVEDAPPQEPSSVAPVPAEGNALFQASGWIEPSPLPVKATALVDGVVEEVHVLQGQSVRKGDLLATLIPEDAKLELSSAEQGLRMLRSSYQAHQSAIAAARKKVESLRAQALAATSLRDEAADRLKRLSQVPAGAVAESEVVAAKLRLEREESLSLAAASEADQMQAEVERLEAESQVKQDEIQGAVLEVDKARLALERTKIAAPIDGRILRLLAAPGQKKMLQDQDPESSTIAILYRPGELQVRVDVPLADASGLQIDQPVRIRCSLLPERVFLGQVILISGEADLQRNTLQAKVSIDGPEDVLRPEMLCRVEFLASRRAGSSGASQAAGALATWIPEAAVAGGVVWVCDPESGRVHSRPVPPSLESRDGFIRLSEGFRPGEWVVLSPQKLRDGQRVHPTLVEK